MDWFYSNLVGGIKLLVRAEDAEAAARQLDEIRPEKFDVEGLGEYEQRRCPKCGSMEISLDGLNKRLTFGAMAITGMPIPAASYGWKCQERGHQWSEGETDSEEDADRQEPAR